MKQRPDTVGGLERRSKWRGALSTCDEEVDVCKNCGDYQDSPRHQCCENPELRSMMLFSDYKTYRDWCEAEKSRLTAKGVEAEIRVEKNDIALFVG